ncbi:MAG: putative selenate reductase subunit YgfK [Desulfobacterales bacterium]|nr:MAG: putative selenate reductase subunit YgfK [Desulfobacterales bacterium]
MSDKFTCCQIDKLLQWILAEEKQGQIFGIRKELFFVPQRSDVFKMTRYGQVLETPIGVAAGPHTQLSQNIISAWLTGARYIELKTVQTLDELEVTKPCIDMTDEGYNCEWSQELKLDQSFNEYLKAWIVLHILKDKFGWGDPDSRGFIFNMSAGYNLEGILNPNMQSFLDKMAGCAAEKAAKIDALAKIYPRVKELEISDRMSDNITISTMHGCPPDEVEKIGRYFIEQRKLNTTIKLNPTLLGPQQLRHILNDQLGFEVEVPDEAFDHDLKYEAGVALIKSLLESAAKAGVAFNLKLTNTLETTNRDQNLPKNEKMVYMSGRALHPISIHLARRLQNEFNGKLDISFSAGTDCFNVAQVLACNLRPVTVCSDILKPGGYGRLRQYIDEIAGNIADAGADSIEAYISAKGQAKNLTQAGLKNIDAYAAVVVTNEIYNKSRFPYKSIKTPRELTAFDCIKAPCVSTCPVGQNIPGYMYYTAMGNYQKALDVILETNPFPNMQGMVCDHLCQYKCTRLNYDNPLLIREIKRFIAKKKDWAISRKPAPPKGLKVAIIGAGPSGLACAYFLALGGFAVDIYETKDIAGGIAADGIPAFRLDDNSLKKDIEGILALGVRIRYGSKIDLEHFDALRNTYDYVYVAVGAQKSLNLGIPGDDAPGVYDQLGFLSAVRRGQPPDLGKNVVVIGGGNSAMDAARTAKRLLGADGNVSIVYRRTREEMPADFKEIQAALDEDINLIELTAPECLLVEDGQVKFNVCFKMKLGEKDASGRPRPIKIEGSEFEIQVDNVISAIGQRAELDFFPEKELQSNPDTLETQLLNVYAGGDAIRGASTLIKAIADGKCVAENIKRHAARQFDVPTAKTDRDPDTTSLQIVQARRVFGPKVPEISLDRRFDFHLVTQTLDDDSAQQEARRCLQCDVMCNICTTVCPNRANIAYTMDPIEFTVQRAMRSGGDIQIEDVEIVRISQKFQIINLGDFCNECGNCTTFCPTSGEPYRIKPKFYLNSQSFANEPNGYMLVDGALNAKVEGDLEILSRQGDSLLYETKDVRARLKPKTYAVEEITFTSGTTGPVDLRHAAQMGVLLTALNDFYIFK